MHDAEVIARESYQRRLRVGFYEKPAVRARVELAAREGWLRAYILYLNGAPTAFWIGSLHNKVFFSDYLGYRPDYAKYGPGIYLMMKVIDDDLLNARGRVADWIDFGGGNARYKRQLGNCKREEVPVYVFASRFKPLAYNATRAVFETLNQLMLSLIQKHNAT